MIVSRSKTPARPPPSPSEVDVPTPDVAQALKAIGYNQWVVLETPATDDPSAAAARNLAFLKEMLK